MNGQEKPQHVKAAYIAGLFTVFTAFIIGGFSIINTLIAADLDNNGKSIEALPNVDSPNLDDTDCIHPEKLATQKGWLGQGIVDEYGGYQVQIKNSDELPPLWEANGAKQIRQLDSDRQLPPGTWTIYTPFSCRDQLGFNK